MKSTKLGAVSGLALGLGIALVGLRHDVQAGIAQQPLTLGGSVKPNLMLVIDNSGSMDGEGLYPTNDGALWWNTDSKGFWGDRGGQGGRAGFNFNENGSADKTWKKYVYLFPSADNVYKDATHDHYAVPPRPEFAFARSADYNGQYYDPTVTYSPWPNGGGHAFTAASETAARTDPLAGSLTVDLTGNVTRSFRLQPGMRDASGNLVTQAGNADFSYKIAVYYSRATQAGSYSVGGRGYECASPDPAAYAAYVQSPASAVFPAQVHALAPDGHCLARTEIAAGTSQMQNFANWFQYHRRRHLALRAGMGEAFSDIGGIRAGGTPINGRPSSVTMYDFDTQRDDVYNFFYRLGGNSGGTPNREALKFANDQFDSTTSGIVQNACQKNFVLQFTDGFSAPDTSSGVGNADGAKGSPYGDAYSNTIADIAMRYYTRIRSDLAGGQVPVAAACRVGNPPAWLDCNRDPHVNHFSVTLGAQGEVFGVSHDNVADAYANPPTWSNPTATRSPVQVDDLYHASINGRGEMLNARSSNELTLRLRQALDAIMTNAGGSGSRTASSSTRAGGGTQLFQAKYNATQWTGELLAYQVTAAGSIGNLNWNAATAMPAHGTRNIHFRDATGRRTPFEWSRLGAELQAAFNLDPANPSRTDNIGARRVAWLRGDAAAQVASGGTKLRDRASRLGDIVNSSPRYVGTDHHGYDRLPAGAPGRDSYQTFRYGKAARAPMVYVGANDGMLHAFGAADGIEQWAFIPSEFLAHGAAQPAPALSQLPRGDYAHRYFVDGQPVASDAFFANAWHTVLVTPMGAGGRSIVALDITDPRDSAGAPNVLWEFTDPDLGHVTGQPSIQRMANGKWAAIFGSGYGLSRSAKLFIVDIEDGSLIRKIDTDPAFDPAAGTPNGLSAPYPVDVDGDTVIDMVYAGDLWGNLWRFDVDDTGSTAQWDVRHRVGNARAPLISVCASGNVTGLYGCAAGSRQPITVRPVVGRGPGGAGQAIYFGTGKFFEDGDNSIAAGVTGPVQAFYAVFDDNAGNRHPLGGRDALLAQSILSEVAVASQGTFRVTSNTALGASHRGWYLNLVSPASGFNGERVVADPVLQNGRIIFTTLMPGDACTGGSDGWLMELNAANGARFNAPVLDLNGDGLFTTSTGATRGDTVTHDGSQVAPSGVKSTVGGLQTPSIINIPATGNQKKIMSGATGNTQEVGERDALARGRTSWRQLWPW